MFESNNPIKYIVVIDKISMEAKIKGLPSNLTLYLILAVINNNNIPSKVVIKLIEKIDIKTLLLFKGVAIYLFRIFFFSIF